MSRSPRGIRRKRTPLELGVLLVSVAAVAVVVGGLVAATVTGGEGEPDLRASAAPTGEERSEGVPYLVTIRNVGGKTAENVMLEVAVGGEVRELEILSISKDDEEKATVVFPPGTSGAATVTVLSYHSTTRG